MALTLLLLLVAVGLLGAGGAAGLWFGRRISAGQRSGTLLLILGAGAGLGAVGRSLVLGETLTLDLAWFLPYGRFHLRMDALAGVFLLPVFLIPALVSVYGTAYWRAAEHPGSARPVQFCTGLLAASMAMVVLAQDAVLFLLAWEVMALSGYFLATADNTDPAACKAGWIYLVGAHVGAAFLIAAFCLFHQSTGSFALEDIRPGVLAPRIGAAVFVLGLIGFSFKIGLMPLHLFLPGAPANAPSHASALLSGVIYKVGVYGLIRLCGILPVPPPWWGGLLLLLGSVTAVLGVVFALAQHNLKRALAYSSFENVGIISMGLGLALLGRSFARPDWIALGLGGALFHSLNHAIIKPLLFLCAGAVERAVRTTEFSRLGGLAKTMPRTATLFILGAAAISGLPPLNGFVSELMIYLGLFRTAGLPSEAGPGAWPLATLAVPCLALAGALALACFTNLSGMLFLGQSRSPMIDRSGGDPPGIMQIPMVVLAVLCALLGLAPGLVLPLLDRAIGAWAPVGSPPNIPLSRLVPTDWISGAGASIVVLAGLLALLWVRVLRSRPPASAPTWDCGFARPTPRMQYTGSSFGHSLRELFRWALWPRVHRPDLGGLFPQSVHHKSVVQDPMLDRLALPSVRHLARGFAWLRLLQQGRLQVYVFYFIIIIVFLLVWGRSTP